VDDLDDNKSRVRELKQSDPNGEKRLGLSCRARGCSLVRAYAESSDEQEWAKSGGKPEGAGK